MTTPFLAIDTGEVQRSRRIKIAIPARRALARKSTPQTLRIEGNMGTHAAVAA
jgi:hypothetical protein